MNRCRRREDRNLIIAVAVLCTLSASFTVNFLCHAVVHAVVRASLSKLRKYCATETGGHTGTIQWGRVFIEKVK
jgi:cobalamin synthase